MNNKNNLQLSLLAVALASATSAGGATAFPSTQLHRQEGPVKVLVELLEPSAAEIYGNVMAAEHQAGHPRGAKSPAAASAAKQQLAAISNQQQQFETHLTGSGVPHKQLYRTRKALNGVALQVDAAQLEKLRALPGVRGLHLIQKEFPTNSSSVPFLGLPSVWQGVTASGGPTGKGVRIGIIDTGVDYLHTDFGGSGKAADYKSNNEAQAPDAFFPNAKVVGGYDFAGDDYNANFPPSTPVPDPDPMDCNGHGTHVAGTAAGFGVKADGTTFTGPWNAATPMAGMRIGPGTAPEASIYALRVFGCNGSTELTVQAIEWAMDPNGDDDLSDHLDVINMSLGSPFGGLSDSTAVAAENAARAGVVVVASAGNAGDTFFISGSPASAPRAISVAASQDSGVNGWHLHVTAPAGVAGDYLAAPASFGSAPAGQSGEVVAAQDGVVPASDGCTPFTNAAAIAGKIALVDRGSCVFSQKAANAQAAGAIGLILVNNESGSAPSMGGEDPAVTIPVVSLSRDDGNRLKASLPVTAALGPQPWPLGDTLASFSSRGPSVDGGLKPDLAAPGSLITSALAGSGSEATDMSGTSMAAPHVAGIMAVLRQAHPGWSVDELKALVMNTALHDVTLMPDGAGPVYDPGRVGAGRVDPVRAAAETVVAFSDEAPGRVSVSFETREVVGTTTELRQVRLLNTGGSAVTLDLGLQIPTTAPGVSFSLPGGSRVTVPAYGSTAVQVRLDADASAMRHARGATVDATQTPLSWLAPLGDLERHWLTEATGWLVFSEGGSARLRLPVYAAPRPASTMAAAGPIPTGGQPTGSTTLPLGGTGVCTGTLAGSNCTGSFPNDEVSLVTPFELQVVSPQEPARGPDSADIQYVGTAFDGTRVMFGISTHGSWSTPNQVSFAIYIDSDEDGTWDRVLFSANPGSIIGDDDQDSFISGVYDLADDSIYIGDDLYVNRLGSASFDSALFNSNVMFLAATPELLGLKTTHFRYRVESCAGSAPLCGYFGGPQYDLANGPYYWDYANPGIQFDGVSLAQDLNGATLPVSWNTANMATNGSSGALLLHHHNVAGQRAQVVTLAGAQQADLGLTLGMSPAAPAVGDNVTLTVTATNNGPDPATAASVTVRLPAGLKYVSDDSGGSYDAATGLWTISAFEPCGCKTLQLVAEVVNSDPACTTAQVASVNPLDANPTNDRAQVCAGGNRQANVALSAAVSSSTVGLGSTVDFTVTATNLSEDPAWGVNIQETFPSLPLLHATGFTVSQGSYDPATGLWQLASLSKGNNATLRITVAPPSVGTLTWRATGTATTNDPDSANNVASATVTVSNPLLRAGKSVSGSFLEGSEVTYRVVLTNAGPIAQGDNPGDELTDVLPAQLTLLSATADAGTATAVIGANTVHWNGALPAGGSVNLTIRARVNAGTAGQTISSQATLRYDMDGDGTNESSGLSDDPGQPGAADPTRFLVPAAVPLLPPPLLLLLGALLGAGVQRMRTRQSH